MNIYQGLRIAELVADWLVTGTTKFYEIPILIGSHDIVGRDYQQRFYKGDPTSDHLILRDDYWGPTYLGFEAAPDRSYAMLELDNTVKVWAKIR